MDKTTVAIRDFRAPLAEYIYTDAPVTITRRGRAIGLFAPLRRSSAEELQRLEAAAAKVCEALPLSADEVEEVVADFDALRRGLALSARELLWDFRARSRPPHGMVRSFHLHTHVHISPQPP